MTQLIQHRQIANMDCSRAQTWTITGCTWARVKRAFPEDVAEFGSPYATIWWALQNITGKTFQWYMKPDKPTLGQYLKEQVLRVPELYLCKRVEVAKKEWQDHYVVFDQDEKLYDSLENGVVDAQTVINGYRAKWQVLGVIREYKV